MPSLLTVGTAATAICLKTGINPCTQGYDFEKIVQRVAHLSEMPEAEVTSPAKRRAVVKARSMVCYWAYKYHGSSQTDLVRKYGVSQPAVCAAVQNGQKIVEDNRFQLLEK